MKISIMFTCSERIFEKIKKFPQKLETTISAHIATEGYGETYDLLLVNVIIQDYEQLALGAKLSRREKSIRVDVSLGYNFIKIANDNEIEKALLECVIKGIDNVKDRLRKGDDFNANALINDLNKIAVNI